MSVHLVVLCILYHILYQLRNVNVSLSSLSHCSKLIKPGGHCGNLRFVAKSDRSWGYPSDLLLVLSEMGAEPLPCGICHT